MTRERTLEQLSVEAGLIVQKFETAQPSRCGHLKLVADNSGLLDAELSQVALLAPIEDEAPTRQAVTARGALFQLLLAAGDIGELIGTDGWDADALRKRHQRIEGCLHSALNYFERECGLDRDEVGGAYFANRSYVPEIWREAVRHT